MSARMTSRTRDICGVPCKGVSLSSKHFFTNVITHMIIEHCDIIWSMDLWGQWDLLIYF